MSPRTALLAAVAAAAIAAAVPATAETIRLHATLDGVSQVPPTNSPGKGTATATLDTQTGLLSWEVEYSGLTGPPTAIHFHGPAGPGKNAGPALPFSGSLASPIVGEQTIGEAAAADLISGNWYLNIHTEAHPGGEIRGQMLRD